MHFEYCTPEEVGISSAAIEQYIRSLEDAPLATHDLIIMRHGKIAFEHYWKPFHKDFMHRMYSVTKSFVSLAIGFLEQDGKIKLDDKLIQYFPKEYECQPDENFRNQTIRHTLMMATSLPKRSWFVDKPEDRVQHYFENPSKNSRPSGTVFTYDSEGSFVLGALVERVTGMKLMEYLRIKLFDKIGVGEMDCLLCPGGHSWSDSALICRPMDLLRVAKFCMDKGRYNGEQILNEEYVTAACAKQIDCSNTGLNEFDDQGYGYQIWRSFDNSFFFNGMGCQFALCIPDKDIIMVYNADNQGNPAAKKIIFDNFFNLISRPAGEPLPKNESAYRALEEYATTLTLYAAKGEKHAAIEKEINGVTYKLLENPMGISKLSLEFRENGGFLRYTNAQGDKEIPFGLCRNAFSLFPQIGYADLMGTKEGDRLYQCAASAAWVTENQLFIKVQIIDTYFGNLNIKLGFDGDKIGILMTKTAEDFLSEYEGFAGGIKE